MAPKLTAQQLLDQLQQVNKDAEVFKTLWLEAFPPELHLPPDWEIKNAVRRLAMQDLMDGINSYLVKLSKGEVNPTSKAALTYICAAAHNIKERENPDQEFHPTARRIRNAKRDVDSPQWDGEAFANSTPGDRQKIMAETIAKQKQAKRKPR
jgi:hypothetical protein